MPAELCRLEVKAVHAEDAGRGDVAQRQLAERLLDRGDAGLRGQEALDVGAREQEGHLAASSSGTSRARSAPIRAPLSMAFSGPIFQPSMAIAARANRVAVKASVTACG